MTRLTTIVVVFGLTACSEESGTALELKQRLAAATIECPSIVFDYSAGPCPDSEAALGCLAQPGAHVEQVFTTEEGDPIYTHFFATDTGTISFHDTRADDFGPQEVTRQGCARVERSELMAGGCTSLVCAE